VGLDGPLQLDGRQLPEAGRVGITELLQVGSPFTPLGGQGTEVHTLYVTGPALNESDANQTKLLSRLLGEPARNDVTPIGTAGFEPATP
jgi:hypothetical protein